MISLRNATVLFALAGLFALPVSWAQTADSAARSYEQGLILEKRGDEMGAFQAFLAAGEGDPLGMTHIMHAARREYAKIDKMITQGEWGPYYEMGKS